MTTSERLVARTQIVQSANVFRMKKALRRTVFLAPVLYSMRNINQAVRVCRHNRLVKAEVLAAAGFNAHNPK